MDSPGLRAEILTVEKEGLHDDASGDGALIMGCDAPGVPVYCCRDGRGDTG